MPYGRGRGPVAIGIPRRRKRRRESDVPSGGVAARLVLLVRLGEADHHGADAQLVAVARLERAQHGLEVVGPRTGGVGVVDDFDKAGLSGCNGNAPGGGNTGKRHPRSLAGLAVSGRGCARRRRRSSSSGLRQSFCSVGVGGDQPSVRLAGPTSMRSRPPQMPGNVIGQVRRLTSASGKACGAPPPARSTMPSASSRRLPSAAIATGPITASTRWCTNVATRGSQRHQRGRAVAAAGRLACDPSAIHGHGCVRVAAGVGDERRARERPPLARAVRAPVDEQRPVGREPDGDGLPVALVVLVDAGQLHARPPGSVTARGVERQSSTSEYIQYWTTTSSPG